MGILNIFKRKKDKAPTEEMYSFGGHTFRVIDPGKLTPRRQLSIHSNSFALEAGISVPELAKALRTTSKGLDLPEKWDHAKHLVKIQQQNASNAQMILEDLALILEEDHSFKPFIKSGCMFILIDDESENDDPFGKYYDLKLKLIQRHKEIEDFFLRISVGYHKSTVTTFDASRLWEFSPKKVIKQVEGRVMKLIGSTIYSSGYSNKTNERETTK